MAGAICDDGARTTAGLDGRQPLPGEEVPALNAGRDTSGMLAVARALVVVLALAGLLVTAQGSLDATEAAWPLFHRADPSSDSTFRQFETVRRELDTAVPNGARIYVDPAIGEPWLQRITEFAYMHDLRATNEIQKADFLVGLSREPDGTLHIAVSRLR